MKIVSSDEWCSIIGCNTAILKNNGFNESDLKKYIKYHLEGIGDNKKEKSDAKLLVKNEYTKAIEKIEAIDKSNLSEDDLFIKLGWQDVTKIGIKK